MSTHYTTTDLAQLQARSLHLFNRACTPEMLNEKTYVNWVRQWKAMNHQMVEAIKQLKTKRSEKGTRATQFALLAMQRTATVSYTGRNCAKMTMKLGRDADEYKAKIFEQLMGEMPAEALPQA